MIRDYDSPTRVKAWVNSGRNEIDVKATLEQRGQLSDQLTELYRMVKEGTRAYSDVRPELQRIIDGKFDMTVSATTELICGYYNPAERQLEQFRVWNGQFGLGFSDEDIAAASAVKPSHPRREHKPLTLTWTLDTLASTLKAKADILASVVRVYYANPIFFEEERVRLAQARTKRAEKQDFPRRQLAWSVIDLAANWGRAPDACLDQELVGVELLDVATQHPDALKAQNGTKMPYWNLGNIQVDTGHGGSFRSVACLGWYRDYQGADLRADPASDADPEWSVPVREL